MQGCGLGTGKVYEITVTGPKLLYRYEVPGPLGCALGPRAPLMFRVVFKVEMINRIIKRRNTIKKIKSFFQGRILMAIGDRIHTLIPCFKLYFSSF